MVSRVLWGLSIVIAILPLAAAADKKSGVCSCPTNDPQCCNGEKPSETSQCNAIAKKTECVKGTCSASDAKYQDKCSQLTDGDACKAQFVCTWTGAHPCVWGEVTCTKDSQCSKYDSHWGPCYCYKSESP